MRQKKTSSKAASGTAAVNRRRLLNNESPFAIKEAYVKLRTSLMFCMTADKERACKTFAVTSSKPSEGKSLTAANVAISYAMLGKKVLLIDADMRKPTQRRLWKVELTVGLCDFLAKIWKLEIAKVQDLPLWIVCTGTIPPNPSELLASDRMKVFVRECAKVYDYVIIDTPPINTVADAQIAAAYVDGVVLVAKSGYTSADELMAAIDAVHQVGGNLCGVVLNDLNMKSVKYSYRNRPCARGTLLARSDRAADPGQCGTPAQFGMPDKAIASQTLSDMDQKWKRQVSRKRYSYAWGWISGMGKMRETSQQIVGAGRGAL